MIGTMVAMHPQYSGHRSGSRNKEYQHADRNEEQHGEPELASLERPRNSM